MKTLTAALLLAAGLAAAQAGTADRSARADASSTRKDGAAQKTRIADLNAQEKAAMDGVTADRTLSKPGSDAAKRKIHADFKAKKDAIRARMKVDRKSKRADASASRGDAPAGRAGSLP